MIESKDDMTDSRIESISDRVKEYINEGGNFLGDHYKWALSVIGDFMEDKRHVLRMLISMQSVWRVFLEAELKWTLRTLQTATGDYELKDSRYKNGYIIDQTFKTILGIATISLFHAYHEAASVLVMDFSMENRRGSAHCLIPLTYEILNEDHYIKFLTGSLFQITEAWASFQN